MSKSTPISFDRRHDYRCVLIGRPMKNEYQIENHLVDGSINDPPSDKEAHYRETVLPGGGILGQLTTIGYKQAYAVGQYLRLTSLGYL